MSSSKRETSKFSKTLEVGICSAAPCSRFAAGKTRSVSFRFDMMVRCIHSRRLSQSSRLVVAIRMCRADAWVRPEDAFPDGDGASDHNAGQDLNCDV